MTKQEYRKYLRSDHWVETRRKRKRIDGYKCYLCGKKKHLNVHHLRYVNIGNEDVENDLVTLCRDCHKMLHRIKDGSQKEYQAFLGDRDRNSLYSLESRLKEKIIEAVWLRDSNFGGDLKVFNKSGKMISKLLKVVKILYPDIRELNIANDIRSELKKVSF